MNWSHPLRLLVFAALLVTGLFAVPRTAHAADPVVCSANIDTLNFGTVDLTAPANVDTGSTLHWSCTNNTSTKYYATICFNIGAGPLGLAAGNRQISGPGGNLAMQIYSNASRSQVWGSVADGTYPTPVRVDTNQFPAYGTLSGTMPLYGRLFGGQTAATIGTYTTTFAYPDVQITGLLSGSYGGGNCGSSGSDAAGFSNFSVQATVQSACTVNANDLDFGSIAGLLSSGNHDASTTVGVTCTNQAAYKIGLNNGLHASGSTRRMAGPGGQLIQYEVYRDSGRTQRWGNTPGTDTVDKTGSGSNQNASVYGRVPVQPTPSAGAYSDTITVSVTY